MEDRRWQRTSQEIYVDLRSNDPLKTAKAWKYHQNHGGYAVDLGTLNKALDTLAEFTDYMLTDIDRAVEG